MDKMDTLQSWPTLDSTVLATTRAARAEAGEEAIPLSVQEERDTRRASMGEPR